MLNKKIRPLPCNELKCTEIDDGFENKIIVTGGVLIAWKSKK